MSDYVSRRQENFLPTVEINKKIESKTNISKFLGGLFVGVEILGITLAYFLLYQSRIAYEFGFTFGLFDISSPRFFKYAVFFVIFISVYLLMIYRYKIYKFRTSSGFSDELFKMNKSISFSILISVGMSFLLKYADFSRLVILSFWIGSILISFVVRFAKRHIYFRLADKGVVSKNVIIVGAGKVGKSLMDELNDNRWLGYKVVGFVDDFERTNYMEHEWLGETFELKEILNHHLVDDIIITIPSERDLVNQLITDLRKLDIKIKIIPDMFNLVMSTVQIGNINALPVVTLVKTPMRGAGLIIKRLFDIFFSATLIVIISPVLLLTAAAIKFDSSGPILYKQLRIGKNGRFFWMLKFRSMVQYADELREKLEKQNDADGPVFKIKNDPRVTRVGAFIRKYSIDELPQLFNVLLGKMSLVGPRPPLPQEVEQYGDWEWRRLEVLPGITGLWQVSGRSNLSFQQWVNLDIYYVENWSMGLDIKILFKTIPVVLKGEGAY